MIKLIALVLLAAGAYFVYGYCQASFPSLQGPAFSLGGHVITWMTVTLCCLVMSVFFVAKKVKG